MKVALYKGTSRVSKMIRFVTRSPYSHAALLFDRGAADAAARLKRAGRLKRLSHVEVGSVVEAWAPGGVVCSPSISTMHTPHTEVDIFRPMLPLMPLQEERMMEFLDAEIGTPYDYLGVLRFVTKRPGNLERFWFCSELATACFLAGHEDLFRETAPWEVPPDWLARSIALVHERTVRTVTDNLAA